MEGEDVTDDENEQLQLPKATRSTATLKKRRAESTPPESGSESKRRRRGTQKGAAVESVVDVSDDERRSDDKENENPSFKKSKSSQRMTAAHILLAASLGATPTKNLALEQEVVAETVSSESEHVDGVFGSVAPPTPPPDLVMEHNKETRVDLVDEILTR